MVYEFTPTKSTAYTYGLRLISSDDYKYVLNAHGDVVALIDESIDPYYSTGDPDGNDYRIYTDFSVQIVKRYDYDAFGNELNRDYTDTNPFRYCAEYFDAETGNVYLRARYYDPGIGRFTQQDPIKDGINWYAYCINNPIAFVDSSGEAIETIIDIAGVVWSFADFIKNPSLINAAFLVWDVASVVLPVVPGSYVAKGGKLFIKAGAKADDVVDTLKVLKAADRADAIKDGAVVMKYSDLTKLTKGTDLEAHHLIEKRFALKLGIDKNDILSIAIDTDTHQEITNAFRNKIKYTPRKMQEGVKYTANASAQDIWNAIVDVYTDKGMTDYLPELKKALVDAGHKLDWKGW